MDDLKAAIMNLSPAELSEITYSASYLRNRRAIRATAEVDDALAESLSRQAEFWSALTCHLAGYAVEERSFLTAASSDANPITVLHTYIEA